MKLSKSTLYLKEYFYTTLTGVSIEFRALSYRELDTIQNKYSEKINQSYIAIVKNALINIEDFHSFVYLDIFKIYANILEVSTLTASEVSNISSSVEILMSDNFKDDTWKSCTLCQERGLDKQRNCPLRSDIPVDPMIFYVIDNKKESMCPMDKVNNGNISDALKAYNMYDAGILPMSGGLYDQPVFFVEVSSLVKGIINSQQAEAMKKK